MIHLFFLGLIVGLSGVLIPGPLLVYTISESLRRGIIGHIIISAHVLIEVGIVAILLVGASAVISSPLAQRAIGVIGGVALLLFGAYYLFHPVRIEEGKMAKNYTPFIGGLTFTAFNPAFPSWWIVIGAPIVFESFMLGGMLGVVVMMLGHWAGDFGWYTFISCFTHTTKRFLSERTYKILMATMGIALICMGMYFLLSAIYL